MRRAAKRLMQGLSAMSVVGLAMMPMSPPAVAEEVNDCKDVTIIGARGTTEDQNHGAISGFGDAASLAASLLESKIKEQMPDASFLTEDVEYPAANPFSPLGGMGSFQPAVYEASYIEGAQDASAKANAIVAKCPSTTLVMMGFSQGAQVMHAASEYLTPAAIERLAFLWLISDPSVEHLSSKNPALAAAFDETGLHYQPDLIGVMRAYSINYEAEKMKTNDFIPALKGKVLEVCHSDDSICTFPYSETTGYAPTYEAPTMSDAISEHLAGIYGAHDDAYKEPSIHVQPNNFGSMMIRRMVQDQRDIASGVARVTFPLAVSQCQAHEPSWHIPLQVLQNHTSNANSDCNLGPSGSVVQGGTGWITSNAGNCSSFTHLASHASGEDWGSSGPTNCASVFMGWADMLKSGTTPIIDLPVYNATWGSGASASYQLIGYKKFAVHGWKFDGGSSLPMTYSNVRSESYMSCTRMCRGLIGAFVP